MIQKFYSPFQCQITNRGYDMGRDWREKINLSGNSVLCESTETCQRLANRSVESNDVNSVML